MEEVIGEFWQDPFDSGGIGFTHCGVFVVDVSDSNGQLIGYCAECHSHLLVRHPLEVKNANP